MEQGTIFISRRRQRLAAFPKTRLAATRNGNPKHNVPRMFDSAASRLGIACVTEQNRKEASSILCQCYMRSESDTRHFSKRDTLREE